MAPILRFLAPPNLEKNYLASHREHDNNGRSNARENTAQLGFREMRNPFSRNSMRLPGRIAGMAWYSFFARWPDGRSYDAGSTNLPNDDAARQYARLIIRDLKQRPGFSDPDLVLNVATANGKVVCSIKA